MTAQVHAAGGLLRRQTDTGPEFCLVHRPRYGDWSFPKGKVRSGESQRESALREIREETGFTVTLGAQLATTAYQDRDGRTKEVAYWLAVPIAGAFLPNAEVDELRWLSSAAAKTLLTYEHDRRVLEAALGLDTTLFIVRHAKAGSRSRWTGEDRLRPLSRSGRRQAASIAEELINAGPSRIVASPYVRCVQTVRPLALESGVPVETRDTFSEGADPVAAWGWMLAQQQQTVVCSHGDLIPQLLDRAAHEGAELPEQRDCHKGSIWRLARRAGLVVVGTYVPPKD